MSGISDTTLRLARRDQILNLICHILWIGFFVFTGVLNLMWGKIHFGLSLGFFGFALALGLCLLYYFFYAFKDLDYKWMDDTNARLLALEELFVGGGIIYLVFVEGFEPLRLLMLIPAFAIEASVVLVEYGLMNDYGVIIFGHIFRYIGFIGLLGGVSVYAAIYISSNWNGIMDAMGTGDPVPFMRIIRLAVTFLGAAMLIATRWHCEAEKEAE